MGRILFKSLISKRGIFSLGQSFWELRIREYVCLVMKDTEGFDVCFVLTILFTFISRKG